MSLCLSLGGIACFLLLETTFTWSLCLLVPRVTVIPTGHQLQQRFGVQLELTLTFLLHPLSLSTVQGPQVHPFSSYLLTDCRVGQLGGEQDEPRASGIHTEGFCGLRVCSKGSQASITWPPLSGLSALPTLLWGAPHSSPPPMLTQPP